MGYTYERTFFLISTKWKRPMSSIQRAYPFVISIISYESIKNKLIKVKYSPPIQRIIKQHKKIILLYIWLGKKSKFLASKMIWSWWYFTFFSIHTHFFKQLIFFDSLSVILFVIKRNFNRSLRIFLIMNKKIFIYFYNCIVTIVAVTFLCISKENTWKCALSVELKYWFHI